MSSPMDIEHDQHHSLKDPPKIHRLSDSVVKRFPSGDVIQHPVSAVKELIENSLDAASTSIKIIVEDDGFTITHIQVTDNGHGIRHEDLPILCERHTTSKLSMSEELTRIKTMGFRGEALCSMSYLGHVTVTTKTQGHMLGYRVSYKNGAMEHEPKPCAAVKGTQIMVENLFYNMAARNVSQNSCRDYTKIVGLVRRFAIHHINVSFFCTKLAAPRPDIPRVSISSGLDAIRYVYGVSDARSLMKIEASTLVFQMHGFMSNANYAAKQITIALFINDRLIEWSALKRAIEIIYTKTLPKASKPFVYISIVLPPEHIDVNMHPTKKEVSMLYQEAIIEQIKLVVESRLMNSEKARSFEEQQTARQSSSSQTNTSMKANLNSMPMGPKSQKVPVDNLVRKDSSDPAGRLHASVQTKLDGHIKNSACSNAVRSSVTQRRNPKTAADLASVQELLAEINSNCDPRMMDIVRHGTYIRMKDDVFAVLQHNNHLYLANVVNLSKELIYQQVLSCFAHLKAISISDPLPLKDLIVSAMEEYDLDPEFNDDYKEKTAELKLELLKQKAEMLEEFFSINIDEHGNISGLPVILDKYTPDMDRIPEFALCLGNVVDWEDEKNCIQGISFALGNLYAMHPPKFPNHKKRKQLDDGTEENTFDSTGSDAINKKGEHELLSKAKTEWIIQNVLFPSLRDTFKPPASMATNGTFVKLTSSGLKKLFRRC